MESPSGDKTDGLEITSIGALYYGSWDKKYWSSSRGKDRYPYPIGYLAVRTHAGSTYRMEVREGLKGPLFVVSSKDGELCTGQTPDIAWDHFQKKYCPRVKMLHGKRFSCKIDGTELFGFRNPLVQRLLRDLVANVNGMSEQSSVSPNFCNETSLVKHEQRAPDLCTYLGKRQSTGKRSGKHKSMTRNVIGGAGFKRTRTQDLLNDPKGVIAGKGNQTFFHGEANNSMDQHEGNHFASWGRSLRREVSQHHLTDLQKESVVSMNGEIPNPNGMDGYNDGKCMMSSISDENCVGCQDPGDFPVEADLTLVVDRGKELFFMKDDSVLESPKFMDNFVKEPIFHQEQSKFVVPEPEVTCVANTFYNSNEEILDRPSDADKQLKEDSLMRIGNGGDTSLLMGLKIVTDFDHCVPDSLDPLQESKADSFPESYKGNPCNIKEETVAADQLLGTSSNAFQIGIQATQKELNGESEECPSKCMESPREEEISTSGTSNSNSEKNDFDSVGQELAKSMMTVLLPQALPLLNKTSKKRRSSIYSAKKPLGKCDPCLNLVEEKSRVENNRTFHLTNVISQGGMPVTESDANGKIKMHGLGTVLGNNAQFDANNVQITGSPEYVKSVIPDSFEDDRTYLDSHQRSLDSNGGDAHRAPFDRTVYKPDTLGLPVSVDGHTKFSNYHFDKEGNTENFHDEVTGAHCKHSSRETKLRSSKIQCDQANSDAHRLSTSMDTRTAGVKGATDSIAHMELDIKTVDCGKGNAPLSMQVPAVTNRTGDCFFSPHQVGEIPYDSLHSRKYNCPLSESIIYWNIKGVESPEAYSAPKASDTTEFGCTDASDKRTNTNMTFVSKLKPDKLHQCLSTQNGITENQEVVADHTFPDVGHQVDAENGLFGSYDPTESFITSSHFQDHQKTFSNKDDNDLKEVPYSDLLPQTKSIGDNDFKNPLSHSELNEESVVVDESFLKETRPDNETGGSVELVGCYVHPTPVLSILLSTKEDEVHICVICGLLEDNNRAIFVYKAPMDMRGKCPSFLGYTTITLPPSKNTFDGEIVFERSGLQFNPDGQCLVFLGSIKAPSCREQSINCLCSLCTSDCCEGNAVKVAHIGLGYVSYVAKLTTVESVYCILVCGPSYLVAVEESGRLHVWIMNSTWSEGVEEFILPSFDYICPFISELKRIPKCASLIIGHNGIGGFGLWDISKRVVLARFSAPDNSIARVIPVGLFIWQKNGPAAISTKVEEYIQEIIDSTELCFSRAEENHAFLAPNEEDIALWVLVSGASDSEAQRDHQDKYSWTSQVGWWRLALLVKNTVIMGSVLDPRASAIDSSGGHGIIGTCDGHVYMWELSTGTKLSNLHCFNGGGITCIAADEKSGALAVAGGKCKLMVYVKSSQVS